MKCLWPIFSVTSKEGLLSLVYMCPFIGLCFFPVFSKKCCVVVVVCVMSTIIIELWLAQPLLRVVTFFFYQSSYTRIRTILSFFSFHIYIYIWIFCNITYKWKELFFNENLYFYHLFSLTHFPLKFSKRKL